MTPALSPRLVLPSIGNLRASIAQDEYLRKGENNEHDFNEIVSVCRTARRKVEIVADTRDLNDRLSRVPESARQLFALICAHLDDSGHNQIGVDESSQDIVCGVCGLVIREGVPN